MNNESFQNAVYINTGQFTVSNKIAKNNEIIPHHIPQMELS